jgi:phosphoglycolate phosphatase-like HAD superfamily hydrolase
MNKPAVVPAVIFDVDGTLVDSNDAHARAWHEALAEYGHDVPVARLRPLIGMGGDKLLPEVTGLTDDSPQGSRIAARRREIFAATYLPSLSAFEGAGDLLRALRSAGHDLAVASSAKKEELEPLLALTGAADVFTHLTSSDDVDASKPDPDAVHQALARLRVGPEFAVMIGDTPYDMEAAARARVAFIAFLAGGWPAAAFGTAVAVFEGPRELRRSLERTSLQSLLSSAPSLS